jgi:hypothetical protein
MGVALIIHWEVLGSNIRPVGKWHDKPQYIKLGHGHFFPHPFTYIIH